METLQFLPVFFLLLSTLFGDVQTEFDEFKCDENVTAEIGKDITIVCTNNKNIINTSVKFCINKTLCPNSSDISTFKKRTTADNGRIALEINSISAILHIGNVQISDQRTYSFYLESNNGHGKKYVALWVVDPVPSTSERVVTEIAVFEEFKSEGTNYSTITVVPIVILLAFVLAVLLIWKKKKGAIKLPCRNTPDVYHQGISPEASFRLEI